MSSAEKQRTYTHIADKSTIHGLNGIRSIQASPEVTLVMHHAPCTLHPAPCTLPLPLPLPLTRSTLLLATSTYSRRRIVNPVCVRSTAAAIVLGWAGH